jgi:hypothetical protein
MLKNLLLSLSLLTLAAACGGDDGVGELETLVNKACECKDAACFKKYDDQLESTAKKVLSKYKKESEMPESVGDKLKSLESKFEACGEKLAGDQ